MFADAINAVAEQVAGNGACKLSDEDVALLPLDGFEQDGDVILDTSFYGARLYLGTTAGLFDYDIDWQKRLWIDRVSDSMPGASARLRNTGLSMPHVRRKGSLPPTMSLVGEADPRMAPWNYSRQRRAQCGRRGSART